VILRKRASVEQMSRTSLRNLSSCILQLLLTEGWSIHHFTWVEPQALRIGIIAPMSLFLLPVFALKNGSYIGTLLSSLLDMAFVLVMGILIVKNYRLLSGICLFAFNLIGFVLVLSAL
jgi:hypothetical protein